MPGFDLFTRKRVGLSRYWLRGERRVLDAGCGNGWFAYLAYSTGATVIAVNIASDQVDKAIEFYNNWRGIPRERLQFGCLNLYDLDSLEPGFDEIFCYETLEHIRDDVKVCKRFWTLLKPRGKLHLCCPNAEHPHWRDEPLDAEEKGGHVRTGYTLESYRSLLETTGFQISDVEGLGGPLLVKAYFILQSVRDCLGNVPSISLAFLMLPLVWFDSRSSKNPYCLYVKAVKQDTFSP